MAELRDRQQQGRLFAARDDLRRQLLNQSVEKFVAFVEHHYPDPFVSSMDADIVDVVEYSRYSIDGDADVAKEEAVGTLDAVTAVADSFSISGLLGRGDGTFGGGPVVSVGFDPSSVTLGDMDGNGILDAVVANSSSNSISVLLGEGLGAREIGDVYLFSMSLNPNLRS